MLRLMVLLGVLAAGCTKPNPAYCDDNSMCSDGLVCNVAIHTCEAPVEADAAITSTTCASNAECLDPAAPICGETQTCRACALDDECGTGVCRDDGHCEDAANILYVSATGISAGQCPATSACDITYAMGLVTSTRKTLRLAGGSYALAGALVVSPPVTELEVVGGRTATVSRTGTGPSFDARNGTKLTIRGITITRGVECSGSGTLVVQRALFTSPGAEVRAWILAVCETTIEDSELLDSTSHGVDSSAFNLSIVRTRITNSAAHGVQVGGLQFTMTQSEVSDSTNLGISATAQYCTVTRSTISANEVGGMYCSGRYDVTNNFVFRNGNNVSSAFGGMRFDTSYTGNRIAHNTFVQNVRAYSTQAPVYAGGLFCNNGIAPNNLLVDNEHGNEQDPVAQKGGNCDFAGSQISDSSDPWHFVEPYLPPVNYHLADAQSPAVNAGAVLLMPITEDFDGNPRNDGSADVGADEFIP